MLVIVVKTLPAQAQTVPPRPLWIAFPGTALAVALGGHRRQPITGHTALHPSPLASRGSAGVPEMSVDSGGGDCAAGSGIRAGLGVSWRAGGVRGGEAAARLAAVLSF